MMKGYYRKKLAAERLQTCYEIAPPRVKEYLESEIDFVLERTAISQTVLELGSPGISCRGPRPYGCS